MKLILMTDFVLSECGAKDGCKNSFIRCVKYAKFLKQTLELWMVIPCDKEGNILKFDYPQHGMFSHIAQIAFEREYSEAKNRCLFKGNFHISTKGSPSVRINNILHIISNRTIEDLIQHNVTLTPTAIKQLGL